MTSHCFKLYIYKVFKCKNELGLILNFEIVKCLVDDVVNIVHRLAHDIFDIAKRCC